ncbi:MAG: hypothetical protein G01um101466_681 [Parcubacteria group bacterium Gr01-1014_66]|nr:MAG: hypothetical protein G01um101466_681 [Parcubacteria group bacterium Gr01-1014_66]
MDATPIIQLIDKAKHIGLILPQNPNHDVLVSAEVMAKFLVSRAICVGMITRLDSALVDRDTILPILASLKPPTKEFIISLDTTTAPISQLRYEHTPTSVDIILSPSSHSILQDNISFRQGHIQCDCIIALGIEDIKQIDKTMRDTTAAPFSEIPLIAMDIASNHAQYGQINLIDPTCCSLTELIYRFLTSIPHYVIPAQSATLLLSGILHKSAGFAQITNADTLLTSHELMGIGADYKAAHILAHAATSSLLIPLIGRALARSRVDDEKKIIWSCVTQSDFLATRNQPKDMSNVLDRMRKEFPHMRACVLLWQYPNHQEIHASIAADTQLLELLREKTNGEYHDMHIELADTYDSFVSAEHQIAALLDDVL